MASAGDICAPRDTCSSLTDFSYFKPVLKSKDLLN